ncbi:hypothetical protein [Anaeromicrobium sediminis]|uniref:Uncharacterized protein n=1 Tax=Anaeromicrobium sediminis TaxID=1478221 RepID=A0A267MJW0_9FIRM|nr:hypothetical protein [Anaeromicrobium sediminis]PAB59198.1 hypothetical protein CCE28_11815 [Anaeromicrobium sediminis]
MERQKYDYMILTTEKNEKERRIIEEKLIEKGFNVCSKTYNKNIKYYIEYAQNNETDEIIQIEDDYLKNISLKDNKVTKKFLKNFISQLEYGQNYVSIH